MSTRSHCVRIVIAAAIGSGLHASIGVAQAPATAPPPAHGRLVDVGGFRLHLNCVGRGAPTVVLESGAGDFSFDWALVQPRVAELTRVCSYDRAGYAWSDPGPTPRTLEQLALELHALLERSGEKLPVLLVAHSLGGLIARTYASRYPSDVAGMILVDATHEENDMMLNGKRVLLRDLTRHREIPAPRLARPDSAGSGGAAPQGAEGTIEAPYDRLPSDVQGLRRWASVRPTYSAARSGEFDFLAEDAALIHATRATQPRTLGDIPLVVLTRRNAPKTFMALQKDLTTLSSRGEQRIAATDDHHIQLGDPDAVVVAVRDVLAMVQGKHR